MEDLLSAMAAAQVSVEPNSISAPHPRFAQYKAKGKVPQEARRRKFLEAQKKKRYNYVAHARGLATNCWSEMGDIESIADGVDESNVELEKEENCDMEVDCKPRKPPRTYKDQLMLSEWLVEVPSDLDQEWLLKLCPVGKRAFVVASMGRTKAYSRSGYLVNTFSSDLPGGNKRHRSKNTGSQSVYCLLDCIYNEAAKTYFILDVMCWNSYPLFDSETEFRFYWLHQKVEENPQVEVTSSANPYKFVRLPFVECDLQTLKTTLWSDLPFPCQLDGLLFYHKRSHYTSGSTPLVGWLKAYMMPEMLNIEVPPTLCNDKPSDYTNMPEYVSGFHKRDQQRKEVLKNAMQCET